MAYALNIHADRTPRRIRPLKAWGHMKNLLKDNEDTEQVFHIVDALNGNALITDLKKFAATPGGQARLTERRYLPEILDDHETLRKLPAGSVGQAYVDFMEREGLTAAGLVEESEKWWSGQDIYDDDVEFYGHRLRDTHDLFHVLTGYGRDQLGETSVLAFSHSQNNSRGNLFISYIGAWDLKKLAPRGSKIISVINEGRRNGKIAKKIVAEDIVALLAEPLDAARQRLGVQEPILYKRALSMLNDIGYEGQLSAA